jgi:hypothetical protein
MTTPAFDGSGRRLTAALQERPSLSLEFYSYGILLRKCSGDTVQEYPVDPQHGEQALFVNDLMAAVAAQYLWCRLYRQPIHTFVSFIDGDSLSVRSLPICTDELLPIWNEKSNRSRNSSARILIMQTPQDRMYTRKRIRHALETLY